MSHDDVELWIKEDEELSDTPLTKYRNYLVDGGLDGLVQRGLTDEEIMKRIQERLGEHDAKVFLNEIQKKIRSNRRAAKKASAASLDVIHDKAPRKDSKG